MNRRAPVYALSAVVIFALCAPSMGCGPASVSPAITMTQAVASATLAEAALISLGTLNAAGKLTPQQYDRAADLSRKVGQLALWIADNPRHPATAQSLEDLRAASEALKRLAEEVRVSAEPR
jgi:hypothetical protein